MYSNSYSPPIDDRQQAMEEGTYSLFPMVEKTYEAAISPRMEAELRALGQSRASVLLGQADEWPMEFIKQKNGIDFYDYIDRDLYTLKGTIRINGNISSSDVMTLLNANDSAQFRDTMQAFFSTFFLDGVVLHNTTSPASINETLCVKWLALQSIKPSFPHRDYVYLQYGDCHNHTGVHIWESLELKKCPPMTDTSLNVSRSNFLRCGFIATEDNDDDGGGVSLSFFLSETFSTTSVSSVVKNWMLKIVTTALHNISRHAEIQRLSHLMQQQQQQRTSTKKTNDDNHCNQCMKKFKSVIRKRYECEICANSICSKCFEIKQVVLDEKRCLQDIRACTLCITGKQRDEEKNTTTLEKKNTLEEEKNSTTTLEKDFQVEKVQCHNNTSTVLQKQESITSIPRDRKRSSVQTDDSEFFEFQRLSCLGGTELLVNELEAESEPEACTEEDSNGDVITSNSTFQYALSYRNTKQAWPSAPIPVNEDERIEIVNSLLKAKGVTSTSLQQLCQAAVDTMKDDDDDKCLYAASIVLIGKSIGTFVARVGSPNVSELSRAICLEAHTIMETRSTIVLDTRLDVRFAHNPLVTGPASIKFYAGFPITLEHHHKNIITIGSLSVTSQSEKHQVEKEKLEALSKLASAISSTFQNVEELLNDDKEETAKFKKHDSFSF